MSLFEAPGTVCSVARLSSCLCSREKEPEGDPFKSIPYKNDESLSLELLMHSVRIHKKLIDHFVSLIHPTKDTAFGADAMTEFSSLSSPSHCPSVLEKPVIRGRFARKRVLADQCPRFSFHAIKRFVGH